MQRNFLLSLFLIFSITLSSTLRGTANQRTELIGKLPAFHGKISPDEKWFAHTISEKDRWYLRVFDLKSRKAKFNIPLLQKPWFLPESLQWTSDNKSIIGTLWSARPIKNGSHTGEIGVLIYELGGKIKIFKDKLVPLADSMSTEVRLSPDNKNIWLGCAANYRAWDLKSGRLLHRFQDEGGRSSSISYFGALSNDCRTFFHSGESWFQKFDTATKKELPKPQRLYGLDDGDLQFSPDSSLIVHEDWISQSNTDNPVLRIVEANTGKLLWKPSAWPRFSQDSKFCLIEFPNRIEKRDARTGTLQATFPPITKESSLFQIVNEKAFYWQDDKGNVYRTALK